jgi:hypothetical protein
LEGRYRLEGLAFVYSDRDTGRVTAGIFSAADLKHRMAEREAAKAAEELRHMKEQEEKQKAVMEELHKPLERTAEQLQARSITLRVTSPSRT